MKCIHLNIRQATFLILSILINNSQHSLIADSSMVLTSKDDSVKNAPSTGYPPKSNCPSEIECQKNPECYSCPFSESCIYGKEYNVTCEVSANITNCYGQRNFTKLYVCRYCYQTETWEHTCDYIANCNSVATSRTPYPTNCTVRNKVLCLGKRTFKKNVLCNWTGGYRWSTALALSITLGGFGADRFYLGHWQEGIGKLFSFGGLGVWTLIDAILISLHYLGPADGSLYI